MEWSLVVSLGKWGVALFAPKGYDLQLPLKGGFRQLGGWGEKSRGMRITNNISNNSGVFDSGRLKGSRSYINVSEFSHRLYAGVSTCLKL